MTKARQRLAAGMSPVPLTLRDGTSIGLRPIYPGYQRRLMQAGALVSPETLRLPLTGGPLAGLLFEMGS